MNRALSRALITVLVLAAAGGGAWAWKRSQTLPPEQRYKQQAVETGDVTQTVSANGTLNPVTLVNVGTQVSGTVKRLHVDFNDQVKAGQVLAELDDAIYSAQVRQSDASVASAQAALDLARASETRLQSLFAQEFVSRQELDQAVQARRAAEAQLRLARAQNDRDRANLGYSVIRSPVSGVVVDRQIDTGQTVAASFQTPTLFKIAQDLTEMQIYTTFAEADIGNIRVDQPVRFNVDAFPNRSFQGKVKQIRLNPTTTQNVVTYNVVIAVDNPEQILLPGMTAYVNIAVARRSGVLLVPNAALRYKPSGGEPAEGTRAAGAQAPAGGGAPPGPRRGGREAGKSTVHVLDAGGGGTLRAVPVQIGITDNRNTEIVGGELKAGDRVVTGENQPAAAPGSKSGFQMRLF